MLDILQIPVLSDNYIYLLHDTVSGETAVVDPAEAAPVLSALDARGWPLNWILNTHHHSDHVGGNRVLKQATGCTVIGSALDPQRIPGIDRQVEDGDSVYLGRHKACVLSVPGHTCGHIAFCFREDNALFCGDTLFALGCGRLFEGSPEQMWQSLCTLRALPDTMRVYCAHEYTQANARFARTIDPGNLDLQKRAEVIATLRQQGQPTVPSTLAEERATNPFLRADQPALQAALGLTQAPAVAVFAEIRRRKDCF